MPQLYKTLITILLSIITFQASAHEYKIASLAIDHPYIYETPPTAPVAGGYLTINNTGNTDDRLIAIKATFSNHIEIHDMRVENDIMRMYKLENGVSIPAGKTVSLQRGSKHIMFMQLQKRMQDGKEYKATLVFEKAGEVDVYFAVEKATEQSKH